MKSPPAARTMPYELTIVIDRRRRTKSTEGPAPRCGPRTTALRHVGPSPSQEVEEGAVFARSARRQGIRPLMGACCAMPICNPRWAVRRRGHTWKVCPSFWQKLHFRG